jgi:hypothetical protein
MRRPILRVLLGLVGARCPAVQSSSGAAEASRSIEESKAFAEALRQHTPPKLKQH